MERLVNKSISFYDKTAGTFRRVKSRELAGCVIKLNGLVDVYTSCRPPSANNTPSLRNLRNSLLSFFNYLPSVSGEWTARSDRLEATRKAFLPYLDNYSDDELGLALIGLRQLTGTNKKRALDIEETTFEVARELERRNILTFSEALKYIDAVEKETA